MNKHICFVLSHYFDLTNPSVGGAELQMRFLAHELARAGYEISFVHLDNEHHPQTSKQTEEGWTLHSFRGPKRLKLLWGFSILPKLKKIDADFYYQRGGSSLTFGTALFTIVHDKTFIWAAARLDDCDPRLWVQVRLRSSNSMGKRFMKWLAVHLERALVNWSIRKADRLLCQTYEQRKLLYQHLGIVHSRSKVIPNGHYVPRSDASLSKADPPIVLWLNSIKPVKQPELFIEMAEQLSNSSCRFVMAGPLIDRSRYEWLLKIKVKELPNFEYVGALPYHQALSKMDQASILVNTSLIEGFPNTFIEAWLRKTPVISLNCDPDKVIKTNNLGRHSRSFSRMIQHVKELIASPELLTQLGQCCYDYARIHHDIEKNATLLAQQLDRKDPI